MIDVADVRRRYRPSWIRIAVFGSVTTGMTAWFLPRDAGAFTAVAALLLALLPLVDSLPRTAGLTSTTEAERVRRYLDSIEFATIGADTGDRAAMRDTLSRISRRTSMVGGVSAAVEAVRHLLPLSTTQKIISAQRDQIRGQAALLNDISRLNAQVSQLNAVILEIDRKSRRDSMISFWGGVAISIPISVLVNLATR